MANPKERDRFYNLKYISFCLSQLPPESQTTLEDFVRYAKWKLCEARGVLMKDPIWDQYRDEEILVEYYALQFEKDKEFRTEFEATLDLGDDYEDIADWFDMQVLKNKASIESERRKLEKEHEKDAEEFEFVPPKPGERE